MPVINSSGKGVILGSGNTLNSLKFSGTADNAVSGVDNSNVNVNVGTLTLRDIEVANTGTAGAGIVLTGGGTVTSAGTNILATKTGTALNVTNTTIGASGLTFRSISVTGNGTNPANGVILSNVKNGAGTGNFTVTGNSSGICGGSVTNTATPGTQATVTAPDTTDCTGGLIQSTSGIGMNLATVGNVSLTRVRLLNSGTTSIEINGASDVTFDHSLIQDNAGVAGDEGLYLLNVSGTAAITNDTVDSAPDYQIRVDNNNTNMTGFTLSGSTIKCTSGNTCQPTGSVGNDGLLLQMRGTSVLPSGSMTGNFFTGLRTTGAQILTNDTGRIGSATGGVITAPAASNSFTVQNNTSTGNNIFVDISPSQSSSEAFQVLNNTIVGRITPANATSIQASSHAINSQSAAGSDTGTSHFQVGKIDGNVIGIQGTKDSGSGFGAGIRAYVQGDNTQGSFTISNNTIREVPNSDVIIAFAQNGRGVTNSTSARFQITNNTLPQPSGTNLSLGCGTNTPCAAPEGVIWVYADEGVHNCALVTGNVVYDAQWTPAGNFDVFLSARTGPPAGSAVTIQTGANGGNSAAALSYINSNNTLNGTNKSFDESGAATTVASCGSFPLLIHSGGVMPYGSALTPFFARSERAASGDLAPAMGLNGIWRSNSGCAADAHEGDAARATSASVTYSLSQQQLDAVVSAALARWKAAGLTPQQIATLRAVRFEIGDLSGSYLGEAEGDRVLIDRGAGGNGWYTGSDRQSDLDFANAASSTRRYTDSRRAPAGRVDLLTAVEHEMGHRLGLEDSYSASDRDSLMYGYLTVGERRLPSRALLALAGHDGHAGPHFLQLGTAGLSRIGRAFAGGNSYAATAASAAASTVTVNGAGSGFTLPVGKTVTVTFSVTVNTGGGFSSVSNQGTVSGSNFSQVLTDDPDNPGGAGSPSQTVTQVAQPPVISAHDAKAVEPASGTAPMAFSVTLDHAFPQTVTVGYQTANGTATGGNCGDAGVDYQTTNGSLTFAAGEVFKVVSVPVCADNADNTDADETFQLQLVSPSSNASLGTSAATGTITETNTPGTFLISEIRTNGPGGDGDDFVELYNNSGADMTVQASDSSPGYGVFKMGADCSAAPVLVGVVQNGTTIPLRGHFLLTGSQYTLGSYGASDGTLDATASSKDIEADRNVAVFTTTDVTKLSPATRLDTVGFGNNKGGVCDLLREGNTLPAVAAQFAASPPDYSFFRSLVGTGLPADTNDNSADFRYADTTAASPVLGLQQLGAPGPEGMLSPINWGSQIKATLFDPAASTSDPANRERVGPVGTGTLTIRRTFTNNTGLTVKKLRFRVVDMTTAPQAVGNGTADLRLTSSPLANVGLSGGGSKQVVQMTLEPPSQTAGAGGGLNSSILADVAGGLASGHSIDVQFQMTVKQAGTFRFFVIVEAVLH